MYTQIILENKQKDIINLINIKMFKKLLISLTILFFSFQGIYAYSLDEISKHNTSSDCWVIFEDSVYDLTEYIYQHDIYLDIREWCGTDMTQAFITKDNTGRDHKGSSYGLLEQYKIGDIDKESNKVIQTEEEENTTIIDTTQQKDTKSNSNPYNIIVPLLLSLSLYWIPYILIKRKNPMGIKKFNAFWNTLLILLLLIPAFGFGIYMILRYRFPTLWDTSFDFMYWHVELSLVMGILGINHFLQRLKVYLLQLGKSK